MLFSPLHYVPTPSRKKHCRQIDVFKKIPLHYCKDIQYSTSWEIDQPAPSKNVIAITTQPI